MNKNANWWIAVILISTSILFFILGLTHPILETGYGFGPIRLVQDFIYLSSSFRFFMNNGDWFVGSILLFFTIIFPIIKYLFLVLTLAGFQFSRSKITVGILEIINKWAMLDVFVVALLILHLKFDSVIIVSNLEIGTTYFALSIVLLMICSLLISKSIPKAKTIEEK